MIDDMPKKHTILQSVTIELGGNRNSAETSIGLFELRHLDVADINGEGRHSGNASPFTRLILT
jgi:hypothetical protein